MFSEIKSFFKSTVIYGLAGSLRSFSEFLLLPIYARFLEPSEFGTLDIVIVYLAILTMVVVFEMNNGVMRFYFNDHSFEYRRRLVSSAFLYHFGLSIAAFILILIFDEQLGLWLLGDSFRGHLFILAGGFLVVNSLFTLPVNLLRAQNRPRLYAAVVLSNIFLYVAGTVYFVVVLKSGIEGILMAKIISGIPLLAVSVYIQREYLGLRFDKAILIKLLRFSAPLLPAGAALWGISSLSRVFLLAYCDLDEIGLFSIAGKFSVIITLFVLAIQLAWPQFAFSKMNDRQARTIFARIFAYYGAGSAWIVVSLALLGDLIIKTVATPAYYPASRLIFPLALGIMFYGVFYIFTTGSNIVRKTSRILIPVGAGVAANVSLNLIFAPVFGVDAVAWISAATYIVMASVMFIIAQKSYYIPFEWGKIARLSFVSSIIIWGAGYIPSDGGYLYLAIRLILVSGFPVILYLAGFFDNEEKRVISGKLLMRKRAENGMAAIDTLPVVSEEAPMNSAREYIDV